MPKARMIIIFAIVAAALAFGAWWYFFLRGASHNGEGKAALRVGAHEFRVDVANTALSRMRGLSGRESLAEGEGMYFIFGSAGEHGFWMRNMRFPIDIVWIRDGVVVGVSQGAEPQPGASLLSLRIYKPPEPVDAVLEINAGTAAALRIKAGDGVVLE